MCVKKDTLIYRNVLQKIGALGKDNAAIKVAEADIWEEETLLSWGHQSFSQDIELIS